MGRSPHLWFANILCAAGIDTEARAGSLSKRWSPLRERVRTSSPRQVQNCRLAVKRSRALMT